MICIVDIIVKYPSICVLTPISIRSGMHFTTKTVR